MDGSWIFLSHSSKDIELVRKIRNEFEACGHNPLAFHLKCLNDNTEEGRHEIFNLLKREIDARNWFVFCNSKNTKSSEFIEYERDYIYSSGKRNIWELDLVDEWETLCSKIHKISKNINIYVSFAEEDYPYAELLIDQLKQRDFVVWTDRDNINDMDVYTHSVVYGFEVFFVSEHSTERLNQELSYILDCCNGGETLIPVFIGKPKMDRSLEEWLRSGGSIDISESINEVDYTKLLNGLESQATEG